MPIELELLELLCIFKMYTIHVKNMNVHMPQDMHTNTQIPTSLINTNSAAHNIKNIQKRN